MYIYSGIMELRANRYDMTSEAQRQGGSGW